MSRDAQSSYYDVGGIEVLDIIKAKLTPEQYVGYLLGNILKYASRCNHKGSLLRDAEKLANYSKWHAEAVKEHENDKEGYETPITFHSAAPGECRQSEVRIPLGRVCGATDCSARESP